MPAAGELLYVQLQKPSRSGAVGIKVNHELRITSVDPACPAAEVGLMPGDQIETIDGARMLSSADVVHSLSNRTEGSSSWVLGIRRVNQPSDALKGAKTFATTITVQRSGSRSGEKQDKLDNVKGRRIASRLTVEKPQGDAPLGLTINQMNQVMKVTQGSNAWRCGLREKDVVLTIDGTPVQLGMDHFLKIVRSRSGPSNWEFGIEREEDEAAFMSGNEVARASVTDSISSTSERVSTPLLNDTQTPAEQVIEPNPMNSSTSPAVCVRAAPLMCNGELQAQPPAHQGQKSTEANTESRSSFADVHLEASTSNVEVQAVTIPVDAEVQTVSFDAFVKDIEKQVRAVAASELEQEAAQMQQLMSDQKASFDFEMSKEREQVQLEAAQVRARVEDEIARARAKSEHELAQSMASHEQQLRDAAADIAAEATVSRALVRLGMALGRAIAVELDLQVLKPPLGTPLGLTIDEYNRVVHVARKSNAQMSGLLIGDVVFSIDGILLDTGIKHFLQIVSDREGSSTWTFSIDRSQPCSENPSNCLLPPLKPTSYGKATQTTTCIEAEIAHDRASFEIDLALSRASFEAKMEEDKNIFEVAMASYARKLAEIQSQHEEKLKELQYLTMEIEEINRKKMIASMALDQQLANAASSREKLHLEKTKLTEECKAARKDLSSAKADAKMIREELAQEEATRREELAKYKDAIQAEIVAAKAEAQRQWEAEQRTRHERLEAEIAERRAQAERKIDEMMSSMRATAASEAVAAREALMRERAGARAAVSYASDAAKRARGQNETPKPTDRLRNPAEAPPRGTTKDHDSAAQDIDLD